MEAEISEVGGDNEEWYDEAEIISMASGLANKISWSVDNHNPDILHALAYVLESRFNEENDGFSHMIWHFIKLLWDEFYELISSAFISESIYSESVQAGATRLLFIWSQSWKCTHCFDDRVLENIIRWAIDVTSRPSVSNHNSKHDQGGKKYQDIEMLKTYSTGLLAQCLADGGQLVEDVLPSQLAGNFMRYLRLRVIADAPSNQKGVEVPIDNHVAERDISIIRDFRDAKGRTVGTSPRDEEFDEAMSSHSSLITFGGHARAMKERSAVKNQFARNSYDANKSFFRSGMNDIPMERADNYECFQECKIGFWNITDLEKKVARASELEARAANAPAETSKAAGDAAAALVKSAALEDYRNTKDENNTLKSAELETSGDFEEFFILDSDSLAKLKDELCIQCLVILGGNFEVVETVLHEKGVDVCISLLQLSSNLKSAPKVSLILPDVLMLINALAGHPKFAALFVDCGGIPKLLAAPRVAESLSGLSYCLFTIGSVPGIMERVCALPCNIVHQLVELALELLACPQDEARKKAALFFGAVFIFREILDAFDSCDGLQKMLTLLQDAASVRSGGSFGRLPSSGFRNELEVMESSEKQLIITYHTCLALRQYFRAHLVLLVDSVGLNKDIHTAGAYIMNSRAAYKPLDISNEGVDAIFCQIQKDKELGNALGRASFSVVDKFLSYNGHITMLELCQATLPVERHMYGLRQYALDVLHIVTLVPYSRIVIVNATVSNDRGGISIILEAARCSGYVEPEIIQAALNVLVNLICPLASVSNEPPVVTQGQTVWNIPLLENGERVTSLNARNESGVRNVDPHFSSPQLEHGYCLAREAVRANNGIMTLLQILQSHIVVILPGSLDCLRALACRVLLGLSRDNTIADILNKLQVGKKLSEVIRYSISQTPGTEQNRWQTELVQVAIELLGVVTNSSPTNALAAQAPITYRSRELLQLIHQHLQASGMTESAALLVKEAQLPHFPSSVPHQANLPETCSTQIQWPSSGSIPLGFMSDKLKFEPGYEDSNLRCDSAGS